MSITNYIPTVIDRSARGEYAYDIYSLLLKERVIMLGTPVTSQTANLIVAQFLFLDREDNERAIKLYVQSPGGEVYSGLAIYDTMQQIAAPVSTTAVGMTASFGTVILTGGSAGMRFALPNATIHMHQPLMRGGFEGQASDLVIQAKEINRLKERLNQIFVQHTGQSHERIEHDSDRDIYFTAQQATEYGLIDAVVENGKVAQIKA